MNIKPNEFLTVKPLTKKEQDWLQSLEDLLNKCPSKRLTFVVGGDPDITVVDNTHPNHGEHYDYRFEGSDLAELVFWKGAKIVGMCK